jgi:hypothetical protein
MKDELPNTALFEITPPDRWAQTATIRQRVAELMTQHGGLRPAARALKMTPQYLYRLGNGEKKNASAAMLRKLGLLRVVTYIRISSTTVKNK